MDSRERLTHCRLWSQSPRVLSSKPPVVRVAAADVETPFLLLPGRYDGIPLILCQQPGLQQNKMRQKEMPPETRRELGATLKKQDQVYFTARLIELVCKTWVSCRQIYHSVDDEEDITVFLTAIHTRASCLNHIPLHKNEGFPVIVIITSLPHGPTQ